MIAAALLTVAALAAGPTALVDAPRARSVAFAGDEVVFTRAGKQGRVTVEAVGIAGGMPRRITTIEPPGPRWRPTTMLDASGERVALVVAHERIDRGVSRTRFRLYTGPPTGPLQRETAARGWYPLVGSVDRNRVLVTEADKQARIRARLLAPGAEPRVLATRLDDVAVLAGSHVAYVRRGRLIVADLVSGAHEVDVAAEGVVNLDLAPDGRVIGDQGDSVVMAAPGQPLAAFGVGVFMPSFAGDLFAAVEDTRFGAERPVVLTPGNPTARPVGVPSFDLRGFDAGDRGVAWAANGCVYYAPLDAVAGIEPPPGPCPRVEAGIDMADSKLRGRELRVEIFCVAAPPTGCRGSVALHLRRRVGLAHYRVGAGRRGVVPVRLTRVAARVVRRRTHRFYETRLRLTGTVDGGRPTSESVTVVD
jgi:hypothetical protein